MEVKEGRRFGRGGPPESAIKHCGPVAPKIVIDAPRGGAGSCWVEGVGQEDSTPSEGVTVLFGRQQRDSWEDKLPEKLSDQTPWPGWGWATFELDLCRPLGQVGGSQACWAQERPPLTLCWCCHPPQCHLSFCLGVTSSQQRLRKGHQVKGRDARKSG